MPDDEKVVRLKPPEKETELIEVKPTWSLAMPAYIMILERGSELGKKKAKEELMVMAEKLDELIGGKKDT